MQLIVNSDDLATENYFKPLAHQNDNGSYDSNDTRYMLNKKKIHLVKLLFEIGAKLDYIGSGATGHTFRGDIIRNDNVIYQFAMKVVAYQKRVSYGAITSVKRPENAEIMMLRTLSQLVINHQTRHLILPIITFYSDIKFFLLLSKYGHIKRNTQKYEEFIKRYQSGKYEDTVSILFSEWANRGDFLDYVRTRYQNFKLLHWKVFFFQIISVLATIQHKYPTFRHNDMKANNILVHKTKKGTSSCVYTIGSKMYNVPDIGYVLKLWDFDFACIKGVIDNDKVHEDWTKEINITDDKNQYYDLHYFFATLVKFEPLIISDTAHVPPEIPAFIWRLIPKEYRTAPYVTRKGRLLVNVEFTTPQKVLETDPFFEDFR
jgi:hypothetical protein